MTVNRSHRPPLNFAPQPWMEDAACAQPGVNPDWFFVESGRSWEAEMAQTLCRACPVQQQCLTYAVDTDQRWGRWGATHKTDIKKLAKQRTNA